MTYFQFRSFITLTIVTDRFEIGYTLSCCKSIYLDYIMF